MLATRSMHFQPFELNNTRLPIDNNCLISLLGSKLKMGAVLLEWLLRGSDLLPEICKVNVSDGSD